MTFTREQVLAAAREVVAEKGEDFIYKPTQDGCVYAVEGTPSCLVGHVIFKLDPDAFKHLAVCEASQGESVPVDELRVLHAPNGYHLPPDFWDEEAESAMQVAQADQDSGHPWGTALYDAEDH